LQQQSTFCEIKHFRKSNFKMYKSLAIVLLAVACVSAKLTPGQEAAINAMLSKWIVPIIVGGEDADAGEFPHMLQLQNSGSHYCGASIINENYALTAAHCVQGSQSSYKLVAGQLKLDTAEDSEQVTEIEKIIIHPKYGSDGYDYDVAVLKVKTPFQFNDNVQPIELFPTTDLPTGSKAQTSGWGRLSAGGPIPNHLQKLEVTLYEDSVCENAYGSTFTSNMVCAGNIDGGHCVCNGDSGSPLYVEEGGKKLQVGIVSWGNPCANQGYPAAYAEVGAFIDFIKENSQ